MEAMKRRYVKGQQQAIYLDINATKCSSTALQEILGGAFPNHMLRTANITKYEIKYILDKKESVYIKIIPASEIRVYLWLFNIRLLESFQLKSYPPAHNLTMGVLTPSQIQLNMFTLQSVTCHSTHL